MTRQTSRRATAAARRRQQASRQATLTPQNGAGSCTDPFLDCLSAAAGVVWQTSPSPSESAEGRRREPLAVPSESPAHQRSGKMRPRGCGSAPARHDNRLSPSAPEFTQRQGRQLQTPCSPVTGETRLPTALTSPQITSTATVNPMCSQQVQHIDASLKADAFNLANMSCLDELLDSPVPLTTHSLKQILLTMQHSIQEGFKHTIAAIRDSVHAMEKKVQKLEETMTEFIPNYNTLVESHWDLQSEVRHLRNTLATVDDRSRLHNVKIRGIPETILAPDLPQFVQSLIEEQVPQCTPKDSSIDWVRRVPRPKNLPADIPRDTIVRIHHIRTKTALLAATRKSEGLSHRNAAISVYSDLSPTTLNFRRSMIQFTSALRKHDISYKWTSPSHLTVSKGSKYFVVQDLEEGLQLLIDWNIPPDIRGATATSVSEREEPTG